MITFTHMRSIPLFYDEWCGLLGIDDTLSIYAEEIYEDTWAARYKLSFDGRLIERVDEDHGQNPNYVRLEPPPGAAAPQAARATADLNFGGGRWHGDLEAERVRELARPLSLADLQCLVDAGLQSQDMLPYILGIVHSYVISEAEVQPNQFVVCRRLRIAYRLSLPRTDHSGELENYDSAEFALAQTFDPARPDRPLAETWLRPNRLGIALNWPMDVIARDGYLFVADSAYRQGRGPSRIHIFRTSP